MWLEVLIFKNESDAKRYVLQNEGAQLFDCSEGAEVVGRAGLGFSGYTNQHVWVVIMKHES